jgi:hypothetical protein
VANYGSAGAKRKETNLIRACLTAPGNCQADGRREREMNDRGDGRTNRGQWAKGNQLARTFPSAKELADRDAFRARVIDDLGGEAALSARQLALVDALADRKMLLDRAAIKLRNLGRGASHARELARFLALSNKLGLPLEKKRGASSPLAEHIATGVRGDGK